MNGNSSWKNVGFESALKETERNISSMKYHLQDKQKDRIPVSKYRHNANLVSSSPLKQSFNGLNSTPSKYLSSSSGLSQTSLLTSLMKRIDEQSNTISHLSDAVRLQSEEIESLKIQYRDIDSKIHGGSGNNLIFERKLQNIYRELRNDFENLQAQLRNNFVAATNSNYKYDGTPMRYQNELSHSLTIQKRMIEDETDAIRREIDTLKNRMQKIEVDFNSSTRDTHEVSRRCAAVERNLTTVFDEHKRSCSMTGKQESDIDYMKKELHEISSIINHLQNGRRTSSSSGSSAERMKKSLQKGCEKPVRSRKSVKHNKKSAARNPDFELDEAAENSDDSYITTLLSVSSAENISLDSFTFDETKKMRRHHGKDNKKTASEILKLDKFLLEDFGGTNQNDDDDDEEGVDDYNDIFGEFDKLSIKNKDFLLDDLEDNGSHGSFHDDDDDDDFHTSTSFHISQLSDVDDDNDLL